MSEKTLQRLIGALAVVVVLWLAATFVSRARVGSTEAGADVAAFFEGVDADGVSEARILRPTDTIRLTRNGDAWRANGFQADSGSVARFFEALRDAETGDLVATNPANHERMGVSADSARTLELDVGDSTRSMLFGHDGPRPNTVYARQIGSDEVYLVESGLPSHLRRQLDDWRNRKMLAIDTARVARVEVQRDGEGYTLTRGDTLWTLADGSTASASQVAALMRELGGGLVASRFAPDGDSLAALPQGGSTVAYSAEGDVLAEVTIGSGERDRWGRVAGDSVRYVLPDFRVNSIAPTLESLRPPE